MTNDLTLLIRSGGRLFAMETADEPRAADVAKGAADRLRWPLRHWSITGGLAEEGAAPGQVLVLPDKVDEALLHVRRAAEPAVYVFKDLGPHLTSPYVRRLLRELSDGAAAADFALVLVDAEPLPDEIRRFAVPVEVRPPEAGELERVVRETYLRIRRESLTDVRAEVTRAQLERMVQTLRGLSAGEAERVVASAVLDDDVLGADDLPRMVEAKRSLLGASGCLEAIDVDVAPDEIGGLDTLKRWLHQRRKGLDRKARAFGIEPPRGMLLLGVQGCGKSLCAKVVAADWHLPLLRLDPGTLYSKFIGETESQLRRSLRQAEAMAPVVLWIDEIEKAFASSGANSADGGLSQRMFGTLLSWMQDHRYPIFLVATANDIARLPPELMRKGRFDEVFFVDLPDVAARQQILAIHLARRGRNPSRYAVARLAEQAEGFSGAEIEQAVISALYTAFDQGRELSDGDLLDALRGTRPLSVLRAEGVRDLRAWARDRCVPAD